MDLGAKAEKIGKLTSQPTIAARQAIMAFIKALDPNLALEVQNLRTAIQAMLSQWPEGVSAYRKNT